MSESGVNLALRMIQVAVGVSSGLAMGRGLVYVFGGKKEGGGFAF
jgi:hypothetical protein